MLSVIHPSSNQHLGAFPSNPSSSSSYSSSSIGYPFQHNHINNTTYNNNYYDKKWSLQQQLLQQQQQQQQQQYPSSWSQASSYLFHSVHSQYNNNSNNKYSNGFNNGATSVCANTSNENSRSSTRLTTAQSNYGGGCYIPNNSRTKTSSSASNNSNARNNNLLAKDYSKPLYVDCSIEYELPNAPKVPKNSEPILMIHPAYRVHKTAKRTQPSSSKQKKTLPPSSCSAVDAGVLSTKIIQERATAPSSSLYSLTSNGSVHVPSTKGHKRTYSQVSSSNFLSNTGAFNQIHPYHVINTNNTPYNCCYRYEQSVAKRCCLSAPDNFEEFKRQQHLMHLQAQFSLYIRNGGGESFWT